MTLPVSSYEELLVQVRELTHETILLQRQLSSDLYDNTDPPDVNHNFPFARRHEKGKLFTDNVIRQCEPTRKNEGTQAPVLLESSNHTFHSRFFPNLEASESIRSGELTTRLLAWRSRSHQRIISQEDAEAREKRGPVERLPRENEGHTALYDSRGVGTPVEGVLGSRGAPPRRPHRIEPATPLANVVAAQQQHHHHHNRHHYHHHHHQHLLHHLHHQQPEQQQRELESSADVAASQAPPQLALSSSTVSTSLGPVVAALAAASSTTSNSTTFLSTSSTSTSSSASSSRCAPTKRSSHLTNGADQQAARQRLYLPTNETVNKEDVMEPEIKEEDERRSSTPSPEFYARRNKRYNEDASSEEENKLDPVLQAHRMPSSYRGTWPIRRDLWANQQMGFTSQQGSSSATHNIQEMPSIMSFSSNSGATLGCSTEMQGHRRLGAKVDVVYNLLGMLGSTEGREDMSATLLSMSNSIDSCLVMRQSGCLPLLVQLIHAPGQDPETRERASRALHNVVHAKSDERAGRREARVLRFLEQLRDYCQTLRGSLETGQVPDDLERHPGPTIAALMKLSFDEAHRHAMCQLGGLHAVAELIEMDHLAHGSECDDQNRITLRRYAGMALTNLTFGDGNNKALLCSFREFMKALVSQLRSPSDDLRQVTASVLRNLSWRADSSSKQTLREVGAVIGLMRAAMEGRKESTLKSILSALWNLSAHCSTNKVDICAVEGALAFLVDMLSYKAPSKTLAIVENAGGILRNVSSHVAVREDYRAIIRERGCLQVLLQQLRSPSLTVVSNACGALWNLSAMCPQDQRLLFDLGAVPMLRSLVQSKHKLISMGSSAALKNLLSARPGCGNLVHLDSTARGLGLPTLPTLVARKQKALEQEIDQKLPETCDNIEPSTSPTNKDDKFAFKLDHSFLGINSRALRTYQVHQPSTSGVKCNEVSRSESRESMRSVTSTHSDTMFERVNRHVLNGMSPTDMQIKQQSSSLHSAVGFDTSASSEAHTKTPSEKKYTLRYKNAVPERLRAVDGAIGEKGELMCGNSTISWASAPNQESACSQIFMHSSVEDNLSVTNHSALSSTKGDSQCSITAEPDTAVALKQEYQADSVKSPIAACASLPYLKDPSPVSEVIGYSNSYTDNNLLLQHDPLDTLQKAISPTIGHAPKGDLFNNYAETDLDQPTDYSLRYAESTMEEDEKQPLSLDLIHEDTVKTYYTEGTPRATSLNSSRATSASDLQDDSRVKNPMKKLLDGSKLQRVEQNEEPSTSEEVKKLNGEPGTGTDLNLCTQQQSLHYFDCNDPPPDFKQIKDTPVADVPSKSVEIKPDALREFEGESVFENESHGNKDLSTSDISNYAGNAASKTSNDSGYQVSDGDEDDEDLLAACINIGMQNNRHRHSFIGNSFEKLPRAECNLTRYQTSIALDQVESNEPVDPSSDTFNKKQAESNEVKFIADATKESSEMTLNKTEYNFNITKEDDARSNISLDSRGNWQDQSQLQCLVKEVSSSTTDSSTASTMVTAKGSSECNWDLYIKANLDTTDNALEEHVSAKKFNNIRVVVSECVLNASIETETTDNVINLIKRSYSDIKMDSESSESIDSVERSEHALLELCIQPGVQKSGNAVVRDNTSDSEREDIVNRTYTKESSFSRDEEDTIKRVSKKDNDKSSDVVDNSSSENTFAKHEKEDVYRRQRDPDAMIASLDRLTATLVQQTEAMRERDSSTMKQSTVSDIWNEDSPNDVSFPSISMSAPLIASFKSDVPEDQANVLSELAETESSEHAGMSDSKIIQREAIKLAEAVDAEANKDLIDLDTTSMTSVDLDAINPPSAMGSLISLTASYAGLTDSNETFVNRDRCHSTSLPPVQMKIQGTADSRNCRKKSLPLGVVARRALCYGQNSHSSSLENILNDCTNSHLDNVKPPSMMDDLPDVGDMENSMLSVASITSEIADSKDHDSHSLTGSDPVFDLLKPVANVLSLTCMRYAEAMQTSANNSMSDCLENINPPSLFNEVNEMDESTMEATNTLCSDTLCIDTELHTDDISHTLVMDKVEETANDTDEGATPLSSEYCLSSSAESTPRKRLHKNHLTPKQKRNLAKERYRTYTIAAEFVKKEEEQRRKQENACGDGNKIPRGKCSPFPKLTPKQRRQEDRARFQTQVLENPFPDPSARLSNKQKEADEGNREEIGEKSSPSTAAKSSIPTFTKLPICKALRKKRMENDETKERYRTRTLSDTDRSPKDSETNHTTNANIMERQVEGIHGINLEDMQHMLEQNATIVINSLNESSRTNDSVGDDLLLDCETISLVSNDSESERSLRMRFVNGLSKKLMNSQQSDSGQRFNTDAEQPEETPEPVNAYEGCNSAQPGESENEDSSSNCPEEQPRETKRPRIVKPGMTSRDLSADSNATDRSEPGSPKAIRGRRKALYSNPITRKSTPQASPMKQANPMSGIPIGRSNTSPIVRATRATTLRQNNNSPNYVGKDAPKSNISSKTSSPSADADKRTKSIAIASKRASVPQKGSSLTFTRPSKRHSTPPTCSSNFPNESKTESSLKPLERQGTFTKEESEVQNAPTVPATCTPAKTKIAKPIRSAVSKVHPAISKSKISVRTHQSFQSKIAKANSTEKIQSERTLPILMAAKRNLPPVAARIPLASDKPVSGIPSAVGQNESARTFRKMGPLGQRSNSNSSIVSNSSASPPHRKTTKEATSKIASLWKKVEESKNKQRFEKPDTRQWITPSNSAAQDEAQAAVANPSAFRLFRSSTFEGVPQEETQGATLGKTKSKKTMIVNMPTNGAKYRNSCDLSGMHASEAPCKIPVKSSDVISRSRDIVDSTVTLRKQQQPVIASGDSEIDIAKRISRLGSFIRVEATNTESIAQTPVSNGVRAPTSAIVPPFNYNPRQDTVPHAAKNRSDDIDNKFDASDYHAEIVTGSTRVTTV